ncbi:hypothetical protein Pfo_018331, partial [Paulownia fortunei]
MPSTHMNLLFVFFFGVAFRPSTICSYLPPTKLGTPSPPLQPCRNRDQQRLLKCVPLFFQVA